MKFPLLNSHRFPKRNLLIASAILLLASFLSSYYFNKNPSVGGEVKDLQNYILRQQRDFNALVQDSSLMRKLVRQEESLEEFKQIAGREYGFFLYAETLSEQGELLFWNNQNVIPTTNDLSLDEGEFFQHLSNGFYLIVKKRIQLSGMSNFVLAYALIPVYYQYEVESNYLVNSFAHDAKASKKMLLSETKTPYDIESLNGQHLFFVAHKTVASSQESDALTTCTSYCCIASFAWLCSIYG